jgi:pimeloyl-ACP methyl ester carboxylesterase
VRSPLPPDALFPAHRGDITQRFVELRSDLRLRVIEAGPMSGDPVVLLHGWGGSVYMYRHAFDWLPQRGCRTIAVDLRGFGLSDRPSPRGAYALHEYLGDLVELFDILELGQPALVGQSMGGGLALHFALTHQDRVSKIALINPSGLVPLRFLPIVRMMPQAIVSALGRRVMPRWAVGFTLRRIAYGRSDLVSERDIDEYWSLTQLPGFVATARRALSEFDWCVVSDERAGGLAVPALVMLGTEDRLIANTERAARRLRGVRVCSLAGGHCVHEERPGEAYRVIGDFLSR